MASFPDKPPFFAALLVSRLISRRGGSEADLVLMEGVLSPTLDSTPPTLTEIERPMSRGTSHRGVDLQYPAWNEAYR